MKVEWFEVWTERGERIAAFKYFAHAEMFATLAMVMIGPCKIQTRWKNVEPKEKSNAEAKATPS